MSFSHDFDDSDESYDFEVEEVIISWRTRTWRKAVNWFRRIHWTTWIVPIIAVLLTLTAVVLNAGKYTTTLTTALAGTTTEVGYQRDHDAYLAELSHRLIDQFEREMREISTQMTKTLEENRKLYSEDSIRKLAHDEVLRRTSKVVRVDYASVFAGARIAQHSATHSFGTETYKLLNLPLVSFNRDAEIVLHRVSEEITPGLCWPFYNSNGFLTIELPELVNINEIVYIHAATSAEPSALRGSAPQIVEAWVGRELNLLKYYGDGTLQPMNNVVQINSTVQHTAKFVKIIVLNNYGADFTCLYRVQVFGNPVKSEPSD